MRAEPVVGVQPSVIRWARVMGATVGIEGLELAALESPHGKP